MNERELFENIVVQEQMTGDAGVVSFGESMKEFEEYLRERYIKTERADIPKADLREIEEEICSKWPFFEKIAAVSGKVEIASEEDDETLAALLSDIAIVDDEGVSIHHDEDTDTRYCRVYNARLESSRIVVDPIRDDEAILRDVRVSYEFKIPLDDDEDVLFYARPDDLSHHAYGEEVSSAEARTRLQYKWPEQFEILESITLGNDGPLPERLVSITSQLRETLRIDEFRKYAEVYINEELALNQERPYAIAIQQEVDLLGDIEAEDSDWMPLRVEGTLRFDLYRPDIRFTRAGSDDPEAIEACLYGETFNDADGDDKPEVIAVKAENLQSFRSTWAKDSLANLALSSIQYEREIQPEDDAGSVPQVAYMSNEAGEGVQEELSYVDQLELVESTLATMQREVQAATAITYTSLEAAQARSHKLADMLMTMLNGTIARSGVEVRVMGEALRTNLLESDSDDEDHARQQLWYSPDPDNPVRRLNLGESVKGIIDPSWPVRPFTRSREDEYGNIVHSASPHLVLQMPSRTTGEVMMGGMVFSQLTTEEWAAVSLEENEADIQIVMLEQARESQAALDEATERYGEDSPLMKRILAIEAALYNENMNDFTHLQPSRIAGLPKDLIGQIGREKAALREKIAAPALRVLESMFANRTIISQSEVYEKTPHGFVMDGERAGVDAAWVVLDFKLSDDGHEVMMFVGSAKQPDVGRYVPLSSITSLAF